MTTSVWVQAAGVIGDPLRGILGDIEPEEDIAVIIYFSARADLADLQAMESEQRRTALPTLLIKHANRIQSPIKAYLRSQGVTRIKTLWINNSLAVTVPARMVATLAARPEVERIDLDAMVELPAPVNGRQ
ncbi:hypothetical protein [Sedimenticola sp.]|uniref:hypothetical protein n=1 Tax=Sedimenticola sp. TaxID=1940285 RepID=UPI002589018B|nr:hypothetical protein [Sedimenticola sp.]MCW8902963.1 hypothetical protein [Sedimenticola sp.]